jgi:hypothetical protein
MTMSYLDLLLVFLVGPILVLGMAVAVRAARHAEARQTLQMVAPVLGGSCWSPHSSPRRGMHG